MNTYTDRTEIRAHREPWLRDTISIRVANIKTSPEGRVVALAEPLVMKPKTDEELMCELDATMQLRPSEAQQFMDELWRVGIRPTEGAGSVGQMAATEKHLEDMRRLVFEQHTSTANC